MIKKEPGDKISVEWHAGILIGLPHKIEIQPDQDLGAMFRFVVAEEMFGDRFSMGAQIPSSAVMREISQAFATAAEKWEEAQELDDIVRQQRP